MFLRTLIWTQVSNIIIVNEVFSTFCRDVFLIYTLTLIGKYRLSQPLEIRFWHCVKFSKTSPLQWYLTQHGLSMNKFFILLVGPICYLVIISTKVRLLSLVLVCQLSVTIKVKILNVILNYCYRTLYKI